MKSCAVQQGTTLKKLLTQFICAGLRSQQAGAISPAERREPPPVALRRVAGQNPTPALTNRELASILEVEDIDGMRRDTQS